MFGSDITSAEHGASSLCTGEAWDLAVMQRVNKKPVVNICQDSPE